MAAKKAKTLGLHSWSADARTSAWLCDGLHHLKSVHESLDDLLHLPQTRDSLRGAGCSESNHLIEKLLEDFLRFVDVHRTFQTLLLCLKEEHSAVRRKDDAGVAARSKNLGKIAKEIGKLSSDFASVGKSADPPRKVYDEEVEIRDVIDGVVEGTVGVSNALFGGISISVAFRKVSPLKPLEGASVSDP
ncbi:uncharacterized protein LOC121809126 [Salvia splendens]|uniref:uncharacterized protein LOC121809126 n=1 Tax=Salvia splendens TaxID=180675 RepID=UPI001C2680B1|nr:uncharacterized protein LOC121809126 [Salvia splendens]